MPKNMFDPIVRTQQAQIEARRDALANMERQWAEAEARLNEPLTRREVIEAIKIVSSEYGCAGNHDADLISNAFAKLAEALS